MKKWALKAVTTLARAVGLTDALLYRFASAGGMTHAGELVSVGTALQIDTVWACVRLIAQTIATLPLQLYLSDENGRGTLARDHPLYAVLHDTPNADMTAVTFWETIVSALLLWGNAYAVIDRRPDGSVISITPLRPDILKVFPNGNGGLRYEYVWPGTTQPEKYTEDEIFHVKGFSLDGKVGMSPISQARETLGIAVAAEKSAASFFKNGMRPSTILSAPNYLTETQADRFNGQWVDKFAGSLNVGRTPILEGGWKLETISINPDDAQLLATRSFSVEQICRWFGVSPNLVGHNEKTSSWGSGLEQMNLWFLTYTLRPILKSIEQEIRRSMLPAATRFLYYAEFNVEGLLRADSAGRAALMQTLATNGLRTRNELRALDNQPPLPGGDDLTVMSNMLPIELLGQVARMPLDKPLDPNFRGSTTPPSDQVAS